MKKKEKTEKGECIHALQQGTDIKQAYMFESNLEFELRVFLTCGQFESFELLLNGEKYSTLLSTLGQRIHHGSQVRKLNISVRLVASNVLVFAEHLVNHQSYISTQKYQP